MKLLELYKASSHVELVRWLCKHYGIGGAGDANVHRLRREEMAVRVRLYRDDATTDFQQVIRDVFDDQTVQDQRIKLIKVASEQNVTRRIVDEVASLYDKPVVRLLANADENERFHVEERRLNLHEIMQETHRLLQLCNEVLVWQHEGIDQATKLRVVTPNLFDAIPDPRDQTVMAGVLIDVCPLAITPGADRRPHFEIWDDEYRYLINKQGLLVDEAGAIVDDPIAHGLRRIPGVLLHRREPSDRLLDARPGRDITAAHLGVGLLNVMIMRLSKSQGERQPVIKGNLAHVAKNQRMDGENPYALPPETSIEMLDSQTSPEPYLLVKRDKLSNVGQSYGLSYEQFSYTDTASAQSGKSYQARREKLTELRGEQVRRAPVNENQVITLMGFNAEGAKFDYQEQAIPQDVLEELAVLDQKMRLGLDSPIKYLIRKGAADADAAHVEMSQNLEDWMKVVMKVRSVNAPANADAKNPGQSPEQNGSADMSNMNAQGGAPKFSKGDRVVALVNHKPGMEGMGGTIAIVVAGSPPYYGVRFDDQNAMPGVHKWLAENEIEAESMAA